MRIGNMGMLEKREIAHQVRGGDIGRVDGLPSFLKSSSQWAGLVQAESIEHGAQVCVIRREV